MITRDRPSPSVKTITEGITINTTDTAAGRIVNGVCGHGHIEVLMGGEGNDGVVKDRP